jgi:hypothetical protein
MSNINRGEWRVFTFRPSRLQNQISRCLSRNPNILMICMGFLIPYRWVLGETCPNEQLWFSRHTIRQGTSHVMQLLAAWSSSDKIENHQFWYVAGNRMQLSFGLVTTLRCRYTATGILTSCMKEGLLFRGYSNSSSHLLTYNYCVKIL